MYKPNRFKVTVAYHDRFETFCAIDVIHPLLIEYFQTALASMEHSMRPFEHDTRGLSLGFRK